MEVYDTQIPAAPRAAFIWDINLLPSGQLRIKEEEEEEEKGEAGLNIILFNMHFIKTNVNVQ